MGGGWGGVRGAWGGFGRVLVGVSRGWRQKRPRRLLIPEPPPFGLPRGVHVLQWGTPRGTPIAAPPEPSHPSPFRDFGSGEAPHETTTPSKGGPTPSRTALFMSIPPNQSPPIARPPQPLLCRGTPRRRKPPPLPKPRKNLNFKTFQTSGVRCARPPTFVMSGHPT